MWAAEWRKITAELVTNNSLEVFSGVQNLPIVSATAANLMRNGGSYNIALNEKYSE